MGKKNVLIFPAGTEIAFEIVNALKYSKFVNLIGGTSVTDHSEFVFNDLISGFPYIHEEGFLDFLNKAIKEYKIDCVYPAHDSVSVFLSDHAQDIDAQVIIAEKFTTDICRSKAETYQYLCGESFIPKIYRNIDEIAKYPVFIKPAIGQGSNGAKLIHSRDELVAAFEADHSIVICEYLPGMEYTVDCFTDKNGRLLVSKMRDRERIRSGIAVRSKNVRIDEEITRIATILNSKFKFKGAWFFQVKKDEHGTFKLLEISPRIPGTMGLSRNIGINFPMLTLFTFWGYDVSIIDNDYSILLDRAFYSAYKIDITYNHIYLDFDDTLIIEDKVNQDLMRFIYQEINKGKTISLLSKHKTDIYSDLKKYHISEGLFSEIVVIPVEDEKFQYINRKDAIFIDDSFAERKKISDRCGIKVFDVDMVESLMDWRV